VTPPTTHYAVIAFSGDPAVEHPDDELRGSPPRLHLIACGPEPFCWEALAGYTAAHPLRQWETAEVLARDLATLTPPPWATGATE
jgi:hypothetical protein